MFDALRARSIVQLGLHLVFNVCILVYAILQIPQTHDALASEPRRHCGAFARCTGKDSLFELLEKIMIAVPVVLGVCTLAMAVLVRTLYKQFGWAVWHLVNASPSLKRASFLPEVLQPVQSLITDQVCTGTIRRSSPCSSCCSFSPWPFASL